VPLTTIPNTEMLSANTEIMVEAIWCSGSPNVSVSFMCCTPLRMLCTAVIVVYQCVACILPFAFSWVATTVCCVCYSIRIVYSTVYFCIYCTLLYCIINQCASYPHNTCTTTGWATTVGWLLIMTTVGKKHAVKYTKEATLTKPIHY